MDMKRPNRADLRQTKRGFQKEMEGCFLPWKTEMRLLAFYCNSGLPFICSRKRPFVVRGSAESAGVSNSGEQEGRYLQH